MDRSRIFTGNGCAGARTRTRPGFRNWPVILAFLFSAAFPARGDPSFFLSLPENAGGGTETFPPLKRLEDAVYGHSLESGEIAALYHAARQAALGELHRVALKAALSRMEFLLGLAYWQQGWPARAALHFADGAALAREALAIIPTAEAWCALAENTVLLGLAGGMESGEAWNRSLRAVRNALALDGGNARARYLAASAWLYFPSGPDGASNPGDPRRGLETMQDILLSGAGNLEPPLLFDLCAATGYGYFQQKNYAAARAWWRKAQGIYPQNRLVANMIALLPPETAGKNTDAPGPDIPRRLPD